MHHLEPAQIFLPKISNSDEEKTKYNRTFAIQQDAGHQRSVMA
jgi:hypothetical protein